MILLELFCRPLLLISIYKFELTRDCLRTFINAFVHVFVRSFVRSFVHVLLPHFLRRVRAVWLYSLWISVMYVLI